MKGNNLVMALFATLGFMSVSCFAASPFLVNHGDVELAATEPAPEDKSAKSITLAESLVQLRQCDRVDKPKSKHTPVEKMDILPSAHQALSPQ